MSTIRWMTVVCLVVTGCGNGHSSAEAPARDEAVAPRPVVTARPASRPWPRRVVLHGTLEPRESVTIAARVAGPIVRLTSDLGDHVAAGRLLASISSSELRARVAEAEAEVAHARADLARFQGLERPEAVSRREADQAQTAVLTAEAALEAVRQNLQDTRLVAPFDGTVSRRYVGPGAFVRVGDPLFDFVSDGPMRLVLEVPGRYVNDVRVGTRVSIRPEGEQGEGIVSEIVRVAPTIDAGTRTFRVEASVEREDTFRAGMFVLGTITLGTADDAVAIPRGAVYSVLGQDKVTRVRDGVAEPIDVELLGEDGSDAIVRGLDVEDVVVARGGASLAPGTRVVSERERAGEAR